MTFTFVIYGLCWGVDCISSLHLVVLEFYVVPLFGTYSSCISFCLTFCDCDFHSVGCKVAVLLASAACHLVDEAKTLVQASWLEGLVPVHWWLELGFVLPGGRAISKGMSRGPWAQ